MYTFTWSCSIAVVLALLPPLAGGDSPAAVKPWKDLSDRRLSSLGKQILRAGGRKWVHAETEEFLYHTLSEEALSDVVRQGRHAHYKLNTYLGVVSAKPEGHIFVLDDGGLWERVLRKAGHRVDSSAVSLGDEIFVLREPRGGMYGEKLAHEMAHVRMRRLYGGGVPLWLDEGVASYVAWNVARDYYDLLNRELVRTRPPVDPLDMMALDDLARVDAYPRSLESARAFYRQAEELIRQVALRIGDGRLHAFVRAVCGDKPSWREALADTFGLPGNELDRIESDVFLALTSPPPGMEDGNDDESERKTNP